MDNKHRGTPTKKDIEKTLITGGVSRGSIFPQKVKKYAVVLNGVTMASSILG
jgi:hypothetical protein